MAQATQWQNLDKAYPDWVPSTVRRYIDHTEAGRPLRAIAREAGCHASTILRQIRKFETLRDDILIDAGLTRIGLRRQERDNHTMTATLRKRQPTPETEIVEREARRILRRLAETGACLAVARDMENAVVVRKTPDGRTIRTAVVAREISEAMALRDWIVCKGNDRIARYYISSSGRVALKRLEAQNEARRAGVADDGFGGQHREFEVREVQDGPARRVRYNLAESPLALLARRREKDGTRFLSDELVAAGERLREDFELAQMGPRVTQNWDKFLTGAERHLSRTDRPAGGSEPARDRVRAALSDLGPGLGDVALRCCCLLEGLEAAERRMNWSARSGKIVLRIALQRLQRHYEERGGIAHSLIG